MAWTQAALDRLDDAIARAELNVKHGETSVTYRNMTELVMARKQVAASLASQNRRTVVKYDRGI